LALRPSQVVEAKDQIRYLLGACFNWHLKVIKGGVLLSQKKKSVQKLPEIMAIVKH
jgi:hypothetical protein